MSISDRLTQEERILREIRLTVTAASFHCEMKRLFF